MSDWNNSENKQDENQHDRYEEQHNQFENPQHQILKRLGLDIRSEYAGEKIISDGKQKINRK